MTHRATTHVKAISRTYPGRRSQSGESRKESEMKSYYQLTTSGFMMISKEIWETGGKQKCANLAHAVVDLTRGAVSFSSTVDTPDEIDFQAFDNAGWEDDRLSADDGNENLSNYLDSGLLVREGNDIDPATAWMCSQITRKHDPRATRKAKHQ